MGKLGGGLTCFKYFVCAFNVVFGVLGLALIGVCSWLLTELDNLQAAFDSDTILISLPIAGIVLGVCMLITSCLGLFGAVKENNCLLKSFFGIMVFLMILELAITGVVIYYNFDTAFEDYLQTQAGVVWENCGNRTDETTCKWIPAIENDLDCCGFDESDLSTANTECRRQASGAIDQTIPFCKRLLLDGIKENVATVGGTLGGIVFIQIIIMVGTCCLIRGIGDDTKYA